MNDLNTNPNRAFEVRRAVEQTAARVLQKDQFKPLRPAFTRLEAVLGRLSVGGSTISSYKPLGVDHALRLRRVRCR